MPIVETHTRRIGAAAIACALVIRFFSSGIPEALVGRLADPKLAAFLIYLETGRHVRFSPSLEALSPDFAESPPPAIPTEPVFPSFSDADLPQMYNTSGVKPDLSGLLARPLGWELRGETPTVLILHTHGTESYTKTDEDYQENGAWRTLDEEYNMLSIGDYVGSLLEEGGISVIHDRELHDYPSYNGSYSQARKAIRKDLKENTGILLVLDLHRDATEGETGQLRTLASAEGQSSAQLMLVVGAGHEQYEDNLSLALKLHAQLERQAPGITRPLQLREARFNQDLSPGALLVEIGSAGNTHQEALTAARQLAKAILALAQGTA